MLPFTPQVNNFFSASQNFFAAPRVHPEREERLCPSSRRASTPFFHSRNTSRAKADPQREIPFYAQRQEFVNNKNRAA